MSLLKLVCQLLVQIELWRLVKLELSLPVSGGLAVSSVTRGVELPPSPSHTGAQEGGNQQRGALQSSEIKSEIQMLL